MEGILLFLIIVGVISVVAVRGKAWERWIDKHKSEKE